MNRRASSDAAPLLLVAAGALAGGLLAAAVLAITRDIKPLVVFGLIVLVTALSVFVAAGLLPRTHQPVEPAPGRIPVQPFSWPARAGRPATPGGLTPPRDAEANRNGASGLTPAADPWPRDTPAPTGPEPEPVSVAVPVPHSRWWDAAAGEVNAPRSASAKRGPDAAPGRSDDTSDAVKRVVQCPQCGDFAVDVRHQNAGFAFTCKRCSHQWTWQSGSAWPTTVIRPRRKSEWAHAAVPNRSDPAT